VILYAHSKATHRLIVLCNSATQDYNSSEFVDGDQVDSEDVMVANVSLFLTFFLSLSPEFPPRPLIL